MSCCCRREQLSRAAIQLNATKNLFDWHMRIRSSPGRCRPAKQRFDALKPDGRLVYRFFCPRTGTIPTWIRTTQLFFPRSFPPAYPTQIPHFEAAGLQIPPQSIHDYCPALQTWSDRLVANREHASHLVGIPTYNKYAVLFSMSWHFFNENSAALVRCLLENLLQNRSAGLMKRELTFSSCGRVILKMAAAQNYCSVVCRNPLHFS